MTMHACGHDGHVGTLLAAVHYINQHRDFARRLVAIFQRGEEGFAGGRYMIEDGLVQKFGIDEFYALHAEPLLPVGFVGFIPGFATANADIFKITFTGVGGHGSRPHLTKDPLVAACECVLSSKLLFSAVLILTRRQSFLQGASAAEMKRIQRCTKDSNDCRNDPFF